MATTQQQPTVEGGQSTPQVWGNIPPRNPNAPGPQLATLPRPPSLTADPDRHPGGNHVVDAARAIRNLQGRTGLLRSDLARPPDRRIHSRQP